MAVLFGSGALIALAVIITFGSFFAPSTGPPAANAATPTESSAISDLLTASLAPPGMVEHRAAAAPDAGAISARGASATDWQKVAGDLTVENWHLRNRIAELEALVTELRGLVNELCRFPPESPYGTFLRLPETSTMSANQRRQVELFLADIPVILLEGEGDWIVRHLMDEDGWFDSVELIRYLGSARVLGVLDDERRARVKRHYLNADQWPLVFPDIPYE